METSSADIDLISELCCWLKAQCDGDWEHSYGISIETTDNPGWHVTVDLAETEWAAITIQFSRQERSASDWFQFEVNNGKFSGSGGITNLAEILRCFLTVVGSGKRRTLSSG